MFKTGNNNNWTFWVVKSDEPVCSVCNKLIKDYCAGLIVDWTKEGMITNYLHDKCIKDYVKHPLSVTQNRLMINFSDFIPERGIPVFMKKPRFNPVKGDITVFEPDKLKSSVLTDHRRHVPELDGNAPVLIGDPHAVERAKEKNHSLSLEDGFKVLEDLRK